MADAHSDGTDGTDGSDRTEGTDDVDVEAVVVGAGMAGLYLLHRFRSLGISAIAVEAADDVGGTWYWNRYPGARCDIKSVDYSYSFDAELEQEWEWSEKYATQPEILRYLQHVADKHDLRRDIRFETRLVRADWDDTTATWQVTTDDGATTTCRWFVMATGCLSVPKQIDIAGTDRFQGPTYLTGRWPHEGVDFTGQRVGVIGTGSSAIQSIPLIAEEAAELTVFQRTPNFSIPAYNGPVPADELAAVKARYPEYREEARWSRGGVPLALPTDAVALLDPAEVRARLEAAWEAGGLLEFLSIFADTAVNAESNRTVAEFVHQKIRDIVDDPETATSLCATNFALGTKRLCLDSNYYETFNLAHVGLVDLQKDPIVTVTETGVETAGGSFTFDSIVYATGFDAMTGAVVAVDIRGREGVELRDAWSDGPTTYLGLTVPEFPNFFMVTGPQSPSVLSNMSVSIEQHVEWITDTVAALRSDGVVAIEPTRTAEAGWQQHAADCADLTLFSETDSWYMGANVPGKPRTVLPYLGGVGTYREICNEVAERGYLGFELTGESGTRCNDGVIREIQPDVAMVLQIMSELELPPMHSLSPAEARAFMAASQEAGPPGPPVGEVVDGTYPGAEGDLAYRLYRPATPGPHPAVVYFHGGGWVLGGADSDDALCRDLCGQADVVVVSMDYRHAPEAPFPAAVDDGYAAVSWVAANLEGLGASETPVTVCGWSAGANVATVACHTARDRGGPEIAGQVLLNPATDCDDSRDSYVENAEGYVLTRDLMRWFWDHYCEREQRSDPRASPLRAKDLSGLPPALIVTADFDPLRDEGIAYADALAAAGTEARHLRMRGQIHTSITGVGMFLSPTAARGEVAAALADFSRRAGVRVG